MLELKGIHKYYNPGTVNEMCLFQNFNLTIDKGEFVSVVGSNGSGKTSMLNIICGSIPVEGGQILINGSDITKQKEFKRNQRIGRVYQNPAMGTCPSMTILENMSRQSRCIIRRTASGNGTSDVYHDTDRVPDPG